MKQIIYLPLILLTLLVLYCFDLQDSKIERVTEENYKKYAKVTLTTSFANLSESEKKMLPLLVEAAKMMDKIFWKQSFGGNIDSLLNAANSPVEKDYLIYNYGPWDRLNGNLPFKEGYESKPLGANFYPVNMTVEEFKKYSDPQKESLYTLIRRNEKGELMTVPYHQAYQEEVMQASRFLREAANICEHEQLKTYLMARADALESDEYDMSDREWLKLKENNLDIIIGPIENYEDHLFGYKAANEAYVLVKDREWSRKLSEIVEFLPELQKDLPVEVKYKQENPGSNSQLAVFDVLYYAGDCNAGSKTIAVNLPNDEKLQLEMGTRRSQLKNVMQAKFDKILLPIADVLISQDQRKHINFESFFANTMFHEVAHGLGIKNTINGKGLVRHALKEHASAIEEGKADILGLYMVTKLYEQGKYGGDEANIMDAYVTFMASIFRSVRFGAASAHGKANMIRFNFFKEMGAFKRDPASGRYSVDPKKMKLAVDALSKKILELQGNGDYAGVTQLINQMGLINTELQSDLDRLKVAGIPVDVVFEQGPPYWRQ